jgi:ABC-type lipoprotein export system ATPase subunit
MGMHDADWSGADHFIDHPVHRLKPKDRVELHKRHIGFVFQSYHLLDDLSWGGFSRHGSRIRDHA